MTNDIKNMTEAIEKCHDALQAHEQNKDNFNSSVEEIETEICERAEQLKKTIDSEKQKLLQELASRKTDRIKQIQHVITDIEQRVSFIESLVKYMEELRDQGAASDVAQQARILHDRADELITIDVHREVNDLGFVTVSFEAEKLSTEVVECFIGHIKWQHIEGNFLLSFI
jgi:predicted nuclease with TOPRIM domain